MKIYGIAVKGKYSNLVIENALKKAKDVSKKFNSGVVIAADTVVLVGKKSLENLRI